MQPLIALHSLFKWSRGLSLSLMVGLMFVVAGCKPKPPKPKPPIEETNVPPPSVETTSAPLKVVVVPAPKSPPTRRVAPPTQPPVDDYSFEPTSFSVLGGFNMPRVSDVMHREQDAMLNLALSGDVDRMPANVKKLDGKRIGIQGYALPLKISGEAISEFVLFAEEEAFHEGSPKINELIHVRMAPGQDVKFKMGQLVSICGILHIQKVQNIGALAGVYSLDCERFTIVGEQKH